MNQAIFKQGSKIVYPSHGVGILQEIKTEHVAGFEITSYVILFPKTKMIVKIPLNRVAKEGLRNVASKLSLKQTEKILKSPAKMARGMWSKRAVEYNSKITSGSLDLLAEVVRDLHRNINDAERSYSERIIYEGAFGRLVDEFAAARKEEEERTESYLQLMLDKAHSVGKFAIEITEDDSETVANDDVDSEDFDKLADSEEIAA